MSIEHEMFSQEYDKVANERDNWQARAEAAEQRIAELEAQLDAQAWRPVTESLDREIEYIFWCDLDGGFPIFGRYNGIDTEGIREGGEHIAIDRDDWDWPVSHFRPAPPIDPQDPPERRKD